MPKPHEAKTCGIRKAIKSKIMIKKSSLLGEFRD